MYICRLMSKSFLKYSSENCITQELFNNKIELPSLHKLDQLYFTIILFRCSRKPVQNQNTS